MTKSKGFKVVKKWRELPVYGCSKCDFETMKMHVIEKHVASVHERKRVIRERVIKPRLDRFGVPVRDQVSAPMKKEV